MTSELLRNITIIQAPMSAVTTPELVAAVSNAGGLGSMAAGYLSPDAIRQFIQRVRQLTTKPFAMNLFIPTKMQSASEKVQKMNKILDNYRKELNIAPSSTVKLPEYSFEDQFKVLVEEKISVFSFTFGIPPVACLNQCRENNIITIGTATNCAEAIALEESGVDAVVAQGSEAGGHRGTFIGRFEDSLIGTMALLPQIVDAVTIPIIAAGGIMDGRGIVAALSLGAHYVQMGTAFIACSESSASENYKQAVLNASVDSTTLTKAFTGRWARGVRNRFIDEMTNSVDLIPDYPIQHYLTLDIREQAKRQNKSDFMSLFAGQGAHLSSSKAAGELVQALLKEAKEELSRLCKDQKRLVISR